MHYTGAQAEGRQDASSMPPLFASRSAAEAQCSYLEVNTAPAYRLTGRSNFCAVAPESVSLTTACVPSRESREGTSRCV